MGNLPQGAGLRFWLLGSSSIRGKQPRQMAKAEEVEAEAARVPAESVAPGSGEVMQPTQSLEAASTVLLASGHDEP